MGSTRTRPVTNSEALEIFHCGRAVNTRSYPASWQRQNSSSLHAPYGKQNRRTGFCSIVSRSRRDSDNSHRASFAVSRGRNGCVKLWDPTVTKSLAISCNSYIDMTIRSSTECVDLSRSSGQSPSIPGTMKIVEGMPLAFKSGSALVRMFRYPSSKVTTA